jgi:hypothetical protein
MDKSDVNDTMRENMAAVRKWYQDQTFIDLFDSIDESWTISRISATVVRVAGPSDPSGDLVVDRRVKITASGGPTTVYGFVESLGAWGTGFVDVTVEIDGSGAVPVDTDQIEVMAIKLGRAVILNDGSAAGELPKGSDLTDSITANMSDKSAALKDHADSFDDDPDHVPLYSQLGTVCNKDHGTAGGEVPLNSDLPAVLGDLAFLDYGAIRGQLSSTFQTSGNDPQIIPGLSNLAIPGADGAKWYNVTVELYWTDSTGDVEELQLKMGQSGGPGDALVVDIPWGSVDFSTNNPLAASPDHMALLRLYRIQPAEGDKISVVVDPDDFNDHDFLAPSYINVDMALEG